MGRRDSDQALFLPTMFDCLSENDLVGRMCLLCRVMLLLLAADKREGKGDEGLVEFNGDGGDGDEGGNEP